MACTTRDTRNTRLRRAPPVNRPGCSGRCNSNNVVQPCCTAGTFIRTLLQITPRDAFGIRVQRGGFAILGVRFNISGCARYREIAIRYGLLDCLRGGCGDNDTFNRLAVGLPRFLNGRL